MNENLNNKEYRDMKWGAKGHSIRIKHMDSVHICNTIKTLAFSTGNSNYGKYSAKDWMNALQSELDYRAEMGNALLKQFPKFYKDFQRAITPVNRNFKHKPKKRVFTTKGITLHEYQINSTGKTGYQGSQKRP